MIHRTSFLMAVYQLVGGSSLPNICTTPACLNFANSLKNSMNTTIDPCDDFYEFTCGQWSQDNPIPAGLNMWNIFEKMEEDRTKKIMEMLNDDSDKASTTAYQKAKKMYRNCMDLEAIERNGVEAILAQLNRTGGWPVMMQLNDWTSNATSLSQLHWYYVREFLLTPLYNLKIDPRIGNFSALILIGVTSSTPFYQVLSNYPRNSSKGTQYGQKIIEVVNILANATGNIVNAEDVWKDVNDMIDFEWDLAQFTGYSQNEIKYEYYVYTKDDMNTTVNILQDWYNFFSKSENSKIIWIDILRSELRNTEINVTNDTPIILVNRTRHKRLIELLDKVPKRVIVNYIQWVFIKQALVAAPEKLRNILFELSQLKAGVKAPIERNVTCFRLLEFRRALGYEYVKHHFPLDTRIKVNEIITEISEAFDQLLRQTSWLKTDEQQILHDKLSAITRVIGYPEWYNDSANINNFYLECNISDTFLENINAVNRFSRDISLRISASSDLRDEKLQINPLQLISFYYPVCNTIGFSAAILQRPVFSSHDPLVFQYARIGSMAGHEISHGFDYKHARRFKDKSIWLSNETNNTFQSRADCFVQQYNNYTIYKDENMTINVRGHFTLNDNIADSYGLKAAYKAYQNIKTPEDENLRLPGLESYDDRQLFFLTYAGLWCSAANPLYYKYEAGNDHHSVSRFRVIGSISNIEEFSTAFNCPDTAKMNPQTKCGIWGTDN